VKGSKHLWIDCHLQREGIQYEETQSQTFLASSSVFQSVRFERVEHDFPSCLTVEGLGA